MVKGRMQHAFIVHVNLGTDTSFVINDKSKVNVFRTSRSKFHLYPNFPSYEVVFCNFDQKLSKKQTVYYRVNLALNIDKHVLCQAQQVHEE